MSTKSLLVVSAGAIAVAALLVALGAKRSIRDAETTLETVRQTRAGLDEKIQRAGREAAAAEQSRGKLQAALAGLRAEKAAAPVATGPRKDALPPTMANPRDLLMKDPTLQVRWLNSGRARLAQEYGPLFVALQLSPAQIGQFETNLMKRQEQLMDLAGVAQSPGADSKQAVATLQQQANDALDAAQSELLGPDGTRQLQDYERTVQVRTAVDGLVGAAALEGIPLTAQQAGQLTAALANATGRYAGGGKAELTTVNWEAVDAPARQILTAPQFALFTTAAPISSGASRWNLHLDTAINDAKKIDAAGAPKAPGG